MSSWGRLLLARHPGRRVSGAPLPPPAPERQPPPVTDLDIALARRALREFPVDLDPQRPRLSVAQIAITAHQLHEAGRILDAALRHATHKESQ